MSEEESDKINPEDKTKPEGESNTESVTKIADKAITKMATKSFEPPAFVSKQKSYAAYKADLKRWSRITSMTSRCRRRWWSTVLMDILQVSRTRSKLGLVRIGRKRKWH